MLVEAKKAKKRAVEFHDYKYIYSDGNETHENEANNKGAENRTLIVYLCLVDLSVIFPTPDSNIHVFD